MATIAYTVTATFSETAVRDEFVAWLNGGHVDDVIAGGASSASVVQDDDGKRVEVRYLFLDRERFDNYVRDVAPKLRGQGLAKFSPERGVSFARSVGIVVG
jgi:predicted GNAT family acetyltransferase